MEYSSSSAAPPVVTPLIRASAEPRFSARPKITISRRSEANAYLIEEDPQLITNTDVDTFKYPILIEILIHMFDLIAVVLIDAI